MSKDLIKRLRAMAGFEETWWFDPEAINEAIAALEAMQWRDVREELPERYVYVLLYCPHMSRQIVTGYYIGRDDGLNWSSNGVSGGTPAQQNRREPSYWLPLPLPPESE